MNPDYTATCLQSSPQIKTVILFFFFPSCFNHGKTATAAARAGIININSSSSVRMKGDEKCRLPFAFDCDITPHTTHKG
jgi:hypothetical protein